MTYQTKLNYMKVSVIIPTYQRPELLEETIESVWAQTIQPDEIIIGDDSSDDLTENLVKNKLIPNSTIPIRYFHHKPSLREVRNVDYQYSKASGDLILHLHDDDPIYPCCIEVLKAPLEKHPEAIASFGLQRIIDEQGSEIVNSEEVNKGYFRTADREGLVDGFIAGAISMFPNNGFMLRKTVALKIGYSDHGRAGLATDFYFGFRLGKLHQPFYFVNQFTAKVRLTSMSQSRTNKADNSYRTVKILLEDLEPSQYSKEIQRSLEERIPIAISNAITLKDHASAFTWLFSKYHKKKLFTPGGIKRLLLALKSLA